MKTKITIQGVEMTNFKRHSWTCLRHSPLKKRSSSSTSGCQCIEGCHTKRCRCRKKFRSCGRHCGCNPQDCQNRPGASPMSDMFNDTSGVLGSPSKSPMSSDGEAHSSSSGCQCIEGCHTKRCRCQKKLSSCGSHCGCNNCQNHPGASPMSDINNNDTTKNHVTVK